MAQQHVQLASGVVGQVNRLAKVVDCLREEMNKDLPIQHVALLLAVVEQPGISMQKLMTRLDMPQGSVSRNVKLLSSNARGYGLLQTAQDEINRKQVVVFPTDKGIELVERLCELLQAEVAAAH